MKKFWRTALSVMLALVMAVGLFACRTDEETGGGDDLSDIAGDYGIYVTDMGFSVYFRVTADGKFQFSSAEDFSNDKASGTVGKLTSNYLMMYTSVDGDPVTTGRVSSTHFVAESDGRLRFTDRISYGSAGIACDEDNPVYAVPLDEYEEPSSVEVALDTYFAEASLVNGEETISANLYLTLDESAFRLFAINAEENFIYSQSGTHRTMNGTILLEVNGESFGNVIGVDETHVQLSTEADVLADESIQMAKAEEAEVLYRFAASVPTGMGNINYDLSLQMYANGRYEFSSVFPMQTTEESGNYVIDFAATENNVTLTPDNGENVSAMLNFAEKTFTGTFLLSTVGGNTEREEVTMNLSASVYVGTYNVDLSSLGMPMSYDIAITSDGGNVSFAITNKSSGAAAGSGTVVPTLTGGTLLYTDPVIEDTTANFATFTVQADGSLMFTDRFIIKAGSGNAMTLSSPIVDDETGEETWLSATPVIFEVEQAAYETAVEYNGTSVSAFLTIGEGVFNFAVVDFDKGNFYNAHGAYTEKDGVLTLTDSASAAFGTVTATANGEVVAALELPDTFSASELEMTKTDVSADPLVLTQTIQHDLMGMGEYDVDVTLTLYQNGEYHFETSFTMGAMGAMTGHEESGYYTILIDAETQAMTISFFPVAEGTFAAAGSGSFVTAGGGMQLVADFIVIDDEETATEIAFTMGDPPSAGTETNDPQA